MLSAAWMVSMYTREKDSFWIDPSGPGGAPRSCLVRCTQYGEALHFRVDVDLRQALSQYWFLAHRTRPGQFFDTAYHAVEPHELAHAAALMAQGGDGHPPALIDFPEDMRFGHTYLIEKDLVKLGVASHLHQRPDGNTRACMSNRKQVIPLCFGTSDPYAPAGDTSERCGHYWSRSSSP